MVVLVGPSIVPTDPHGDTICQLLQERDEARDWYSNATRDLERMDFHMNAPQDALIISKRGANSTQARLAKVEARIMGEISTTILHFL